MRSLIPALALSVLALSACGGSSEETGDAAADKQGKAEQAWLADVEKAMGAEVLDVDAALRQAVQDCGRTTPEAWTAVLALSGTSSATDVTRVNLDHHCSDVVAGFDEARAAVEKADDRNVLLCSLPAADVPADLGPQVAMVCGR